MLSASSLVFNEAGLLLDVFNRFYLPAEPFNRSLIRIHGLTPERIAALRRYSHATVSPWFIEDWPSLMDFWERWEIEGVIIHNSRFDMAFLPELAQWTTPCWCSMRGLTRFCALPKAWGRGIKWPRLGEAVEVVCSRLSAPPEAARAEEALEDCHAPHVSLSDCFELYRLSARVLTHCPELVRFSTLNLGFQPPLFPGPETPPYPRPREDDFTAGLMELERRVRELTILSEKYGKNMVQ